ncbi:MAG: hypothetical protein WCP12_11605 [bacterium]
MNAKRSQFYVVCFVALICATSMVASAAVGTPQVTGTKGAETGKQAPAARVLTRAQWLNRIGAAAKNPNFAKELMKQISPADKVEFTQRLLKAITRMPLSPEAKLSLLIKASVVCIGGTSAENNGRYNVIAEVIAVTPVEYLPGLVPALAKNFNLQLNKVTPADYKVIATDVVKIAVERNSKTEDSAVRNTCIALLFLDATTPQESPGLQATLMASLPESTRALANTWVADAQQGNFQPMMTAADVVNPVTTPAPVGNQPTGNTGPAANAPVDGLLGNIGGLTGSFSDAAQGNNGGSNGAGGGILPGTGDQIVPRPYPNQGDRL